MIGRGAREPGRHRDGRPYTTVHRRLWDGPARAEAERLGQAWPAWLVLYSLGRRSFYAIATWPAPAPLMVTDDTAEGLEERMHDVETAFTWSDLPLVRPTVSPPQSRRGGTVPQASAAAPYHLRHPYRRAA
ncbi:hypothetical protein [Streptosporangium sp. NPDC051022]|uniref:hypothetical protein n=1 Tax=Streptosporangium sp. NPDC051022 TaxID=3155752 RepID=UPI00342CA80A